MGGQETGEESDWVIDPQRMKEAESEIKCGRDEEESRNSLHASISM